MYEGDIIGESQLPTLSEDGQLEAGAPSYYSAQVKSRDGAVLYAADASQFIRTFS